jgi:hypothetical protein
LAESIPGACHSSDAAALRHIKYLHVASMVARDLLVKQIRCQQARANRAVGAIALPHRLHAA